MEIKNICTYWGSEQLSIQAFVAKALEAGYDGVELNIPFDSQFKTSLLQALKTHGAFLIAQQWLPPAKETVAEYSGRMKKYLNHLAKFQPLFINSHTGKDFFSFEENCQVIEECQKISERTGIRIIHETHRGRFAFHTKSLLPYLDRFPDLEFNADFSHFCAVSESLLEDHENTLGKIIIRSSYIHARVGSDQSAQVNHPFAPEWKPTLERFTGWWQQIITEAKNRGEKEFHICPEFGPAPYISALPYTREPLADQWEVNLQMMDYLRQNLHTED